MGKSNSYYMQLHVEALFTMNEKNELMTIREPWDSTSQPAPRLGQFTRNYTQTVKRAADNKRRYAPGEGSIPPVLLSGVSKGVPPLAHDFACKV